ncbi:MAG: hypothetical protein GXP29_05545 [Planctomycetes bacterium]|nr:hypothetical protein [Planctomycetota bacterium]
MKILLMMLGFASAILVVRLIDMQIVHAHVYQLQAERALLLRPQVIPAVRGKILDRLGNVLVSDEPCWNIKVHYSVLSMDPDRLDAMINTLYLRHDYGKGKSEDEVATAFANDLRFVWRELEGFCVGGAEELQQKADAICRRTKAIRKAVAKRRGFDAMVREERTSHTIIEGLNDQQQISARVAFSRFPWVSVENATRRVNRGGPPLAHVLGRTVPVTAEYIAKDEFADDELRSLTGTDRIGGSGVEFAAESLLRGARGAFHGNRAGEVLRDTPPAAGMDVHLTIRADLQRRVFEMFGEQLARLPYSLGGSVVVLDARSRECLALVSYPSYDPQTFGENYDELRRDSKRVPLTFRAVAKHYAPGSIVKPLVCLAGLITGKITTDTTFTCEGALFPNDPDHWRCWAAGGTSVRQRHGPQTPMQAIKHSCNIFMYHTGQLLGANTLTTFFDKFGLGRSSGTGLREEVEGINPTNSYMAAMNRPLTPGSARQFAIGQAEVSMTPIQAANLMASYATGEFRHVTIVRELADPIVWKLPGTPAFWRVAREGMFGVVNEPDGTAYMHARLPPDTGCVLFGKSGSAEAIPAPVSYRIPYGDAKGRERMAIVSATTMRDATASFVADHPDAAFDHRDVQVNERWPAQPPENGRQHSHAWFVAYLQPAGANGRPLWNEEPRIAISVMVEFGGSGGRVGGAIAKEIALDLLDVLGPDLDPDHSPADGKDRRARAES